MSVAQATPSLFHRLDSVVNVASVTQRSPFRYPGGKTWLVPQVRRWLASLPEKPAEFIEPFAGGGSVGLDTGFEGLADHVTLVELDAHVASVWQSIFGGQGERLADRVREFEPTIRTVTAVLRSTPRSRLDLAFQTLLRNRVQHGGIMAPGASLMREGENGKGVRSRWYAETLYRRIMSLATKKKHFAVLQLDGVGVISSNRRRPDIAFFIDPPYTVAGKRLYTHHALDHKRLFEVCAATKSPFLMTYNNCAEIRALARSHAFDTALVPMKSRQHVVKLELLIGRDLSVFRS